MGRRKRVLIQDMNAGETFERTGNDAYEIEAKDIVTPRHRRVLSPTQSEMLQSIEQAFDNGVLDILTKRERECFQDNIISGDSMAEIAARYKISNFTVHAYVQKAAKKIRLFIESNYGRD